KRLLLLAVLALLVFSLAACRRSPPANVAASVNNRVITMADLDKQYATQYPPDRTNPETSEDLVAIQRVEVLRSIIDNEIMLQRAEKLGLMAVDADVEAKFNELKAPYTQEEFQKQLAERKMTADELKTQLRRDLSVQKLFNREITSRINITDKDVTDFYTANRDGFNLAEPQIHLAQIMVTPTPNPAIRNLKSDKAQNDDQARKKIQMLQTRLKNGDDFAMLAQNFSEDPESSPNGGDLGFIAESALERANAELRKVVMQLQPGQFSPVIRTAEGYRILKVISKEPAGQRDLNDPRVQQTIRETLLNRRDTLLKAAYYERARNEAKVINYLAGSILDQAQAGK
ncbi:MAG TPA: peptidylprolyl isomerase, partial [Bryobacteraceae bacterium]|nr:peptidylprolyl isomerase [Bryobacteraceae bacterium]